MQDIAKSLSEIVGGTCQCKCSSIRTKTTARIDEYGLPINDLPANLEIYHSYEQFMLADSDYGIVTSNRGIAKSEEECRNVLCSQAGESFTSCE